MADDVKDLWKTANDDSSVSLRSQAEADDWRSEAKGCALATAMRAHLPHRAWRSITCSRSESLALRLALAHKLPDSFLVFSFSSVFPLAHPLPPRAPRLIMAKNTSGSNLDTTGGFTPTRRKSEDELDSNRAHKKARTRVRLVAAGLSVICISNQFDYRTQLFMRRVPSSKTEGAYLATFLGSCLAHSVFSATGRSHVHM